MYTFLLITHSSVLSSVLQTEEDSETEADSDPRHYLASWAQNVESGKYLVYFSKILDLWHIFQILSSWWSIQHFILQIVFLRVYYLNLIIITLSASSSAMDNLIKSVHNWLIQGRSKVLVMFALSPVGRSCFIYSDISRCDWDSTVLSVHVC